MEKEKASRNDYITLCMNVLIIILDIMILMK